MTLPKLRPISPDRYYRRLRHEILTRTKGSAPAAPSATNRYADLYEGHAVANPPDTSIGGGDYEIIGRVELAILVGVGLTPSSSLLDFGCGTGRLALHAVPYLADGDYVGTEISPTMLEHARVALTAELGSMPANVRFATQLDEHFPVTAAVDVICAYSVFTHMEHEDTYRYLRSALDVSTPSTVFVASVLQLDLPEGRHNFLGSAAKTVDARWAEVRNVVTSRDLFTEVAQLAGWNVEHWYRGDEPACTMPDGSPAGLGQSVVVMRPSPTIGPNG